jgi:hypothetical protein
VPKDVKRTRDNQKTGKKTNHVMDSTSTTRPLANTQLATQAHNGSGHNHKTIKRRMVPRSSPMDWPQFGHTSLKRIDSRRKFPLGVRAINSAEVLTAVLHFGHWGILESVLRQI